MLVLDATGLVEFCLRSWAGLVESFGVDWRNHSSWGEEVDDYDLGGHPVPSFFLIDALVILPVLLANENPSAFVTWSRFFFNLPLVFDAGSVAGDPGGVS